MSNIAAEKGLIGCILLEPVMAIRKCVEKGVKKEWFENILCRKALCLAGTIHPEMVNVQTLHEKSVKTGDEISIMFLNECVDSAPISTYIDSWISALREEYLRGKVKKAAMLVSEEIDNETKKDGIIAELQASINELTISKEEDGETRDIYGEIINGWKSAKERKGIGIPTSWGTLTELLGGYRDGKIYIVASRPGAGKSTMMSNEIFNIAGMGKHVSVASLEMSEHELRGRMLASYEDKSSFMLDTGRYDHVEIEDMRDTADKHALLPIHINDKYLNIDQLCSWAQYEKTKNNTEFLAIDYLQLIPCNRKFESRNVEVTHNINRIAELAKTINVPIMVLSQLSRTSEHEKRAPDLHDLRDSGAIEQAAYAVMFICHTEDEIDGRPIEQSEFIISKNRGGPTGNVRIRFERNRQRFVI
ncbi:MAG: replicative DNA helicase [Eubacteriales bacterium]|jgi:replicative DNA helicase